MARPNRTEMTSERKIQWSVAACLAVLLFLYFPGLAGVRGSTANAAHRPFRLAASSVSGKQ
jgi:hypothetical protein